MVFGGFDGGDVCNDLVVFLEGKWARRMARGTAPAARAMHGAAMFGSQLVINGGWGGGQTLRNDTCVLDVPHFCWMTPAPLLAGPAPVGRQGHTLVASMHPESVSELLLFGGETLNGTSAELWTLRSSAGHEKLLEWTELAPNGEVPAARSGHSALMISSNHMLIHSGKDSDGEGLTDLHVLTLGAMNWSTPQLRGDVPRPRWSAACCLLAGSSPLGGPRWLVDGGRDTEGWVEERVLADVYVDPSADGSEILLICHTVGPRGDPSLDNADENGVLSGHTLTALRSGSARIVGGSLESGVLPTRAPVIQPEIVRWARPEVGTAGIREVGRSGEPNTLYPELVGPSLLTSTFTATRCGQYLYVLGGHRPRYGLLGRHGGGLQLALLHLPTLSWCPEMPKVDETAPKIKCGHTAVLSPLLGGICVFGGVRSNCEHGACTEERLSDECWVLQLRVHATEYAQRAPSPVAPSSSAESPSFTIEWDGEPDLWAKQGGSFHRKSQEHWPAPRCGHSATALPAPYAWGSGGRLSDQGAMLVLGGYRTDHQQPDGPEGIFTFEAFLLRPVGGRWLPLTPTGCSPSPRALHSAALLCDGGRHPRGRPLRVAVFGGWGLPSGEAPPPWKHMSIAEHLCDLHLMTLDPMVKGACDWVTLQPPGPPPRPRAAASLIASTDGGLLLFGGHDLHGGVSEPSMDMVCLSGSALRAAETATQSEVGGPRQSRLAAAGDDQAEPAVLFTPEDDPRLVSLAGSIDAEPGTWATELMTSSCRAFGGLGGPTTIVAEAFGAEDATVPPPLLQWMRPDAAGEAPPGCSRMVAIGMGDHVLLLVPPAAGVRKGEVERGPADELGTALFVLVGDGANPGDVQARFERRREKPQGLLVEGAPPAAQPSRMPQPHSLPPVESMPSRVPTPATQARAANRLEVSSAEESGGAMPSAAQRVATPTLASGVHADADLQPDVDGTRSSIPASATQAPWSEDTPVGVGAFVRPPRHTEASRVAFSPAYPLVPDGYFHCSSSLFSTANRDEPTEHYMRSAHHLKKRGRSKPPTRPSKSRLVRRLSVTDATSALQPALHRLAARTPSIASASGGSIGSERAPFNLQTSGVSLSATDRHRCLLEAQEAHAAEAETFVWPPRTPSEPLPPKPHAAFRSASPRILPTRRELLEGPSPGSYGPDLVPSQPEKVKYTLCHELRNMFGAAAPADAPGISGWGTESVQEGGNQAVGALPEPDLSHLGDLFASPGKKCGNGESATSTQASVDPRPPPYFATRRPDTPAPGAYHPKVTRVGDEFIQPAGLCSALARDTTLPSWWARKPDGSPRKRPSVKKLAPPRRTAACRIQPVASPFAHTDSVPHAPDFLFDHARAPAWEPSHGLSTYATPRLLDVPPSEPPVLPMAQLRQAAVPPTEPLQVQLSISYTSPVASPPVESDANLLAVRIVLQVGHSTSRHDEGDDNRSGAELLGSLRVSTSLRVQSDAGTIVTAVGQAEVDQGWTCAACEDAFTEASRPLPISSSPLPLVDSFAADASGEVPLISDELRTDNRRQNRHGGRTLRNADDRKFAPFSWMKNGGASEAAGEESSSSSSEDGQGEGESGPLCDRQPSPTNKGRKRSVALRRQRLEAAYRCIDINCDQLLSRQEIVHSCERDEQVRMLLGLPRRLRREDGSYAKFEALFSKLDIDNSRSVTIDEFCTLLGAKRAIAPPASHRLNSLALPRWKIVEPLPGSSLSQAIGLSRESSPLSSRPTSRPTSQATSRPMSRGGLALPVDANVASQPGWCGDRAPRHMGPPHEWRVERSECSHVNDLRPLTADAVPSSNNVAGAMGFSTPHAPPSRRPVSSANSPRVMASVAINARTLMPRSGQQAGWTLGGGRDPRFKSAPKGAAENEPLEDSLISSAEEASISRARALALALALRSSTAPLPPAAIRAASAAMVRHADLTSRPSSRRRSVSRPTSPREAPFGKRL